MTRPVIFGCQGTELNAAEAAFFRKVKPLGFILFARNCETPDQISRLTKSLKDCVGVEHVAILIDQEGGRVARMKPPHWRAYPPMATFGELVEIRPDVAATALRLNCHLIADDLRKVGITVDCLPVLDLPQSEADPIIGDRAFSSDPHITGALARVACDALMEAGVLPVVKHMPGHGRATVDSHKDLPIVDADYETLLNHDFIPFRAVNTMVFAMTAHIKYLTLDSRYCATQSAIIIEDIIRGTLGFQGFLMTDDLSMQALEGGMARRTKLAMEAGCDIALHCNGDMAEMQEIVGVLDEAPPELVAGIDEHLLMASRQPMIDRAADEAALDALLGVG